MHLPSTGFVDLIRRQISSQLLNIRGDVDGETGRLRSVNAHIRNHIDRTIERGISDALILFSPLNSYSTACVHSLLNNIFQSYGYSSFPCRTMASNVSSEPINEYNNRLVHGQSIESLRRVAFVSGLLHESDDCLVSIANQLIVRDENIRDHVQAMEHLHEHFKVLDCCRILNFLRSLFLRTGTVYM
jgi:hypothetical protein